MGVFENFTYERGDKVWKERKHSPCYVGPNEILKRVGSVLYELKLRNELAIIHPVFHVFMLKECIGDPISIFPLEGIGLKERISYEVVSVEILDRQIKKLKNKEAVLIKVLWRNHLSKGGTWDVEADMMTHYHHLSPTPRKD